MSALFPVRVEVAQSATIGQVLRGETVTWTDICDFIHYDSGVTCSRGRAATADTTTAGSASFTVKTKPNGDVAPLAVRRPVRISVQIASSWIPVWTGTVSGWSRSWDGGVRGLQRVTCADAVATLNRAVLESWPTETAKSIGDLAWLFPLDDASGEQPPREASGVVSPPQFAPRPVGVPEEGSSVRFGVGASPGSPVGAAEGTVVGFEGWPFGGWCLAAHDNLGGLPGGWSALSAYVFLESLPERDGAVFASSLIGYQTVADFQVVLGVDEDGRGFFEFGLPAGRTVGTSILSVGRWHHLAMSWEASGGSNY